MYRRYECREGMDDAQGSDSLALASDDESDCLVERPV